MGTQPQEAHSDRGAVKVAEIRDYLALARIEARTSLSKRLLEIAEKLLAAVERLRANQALIGGRLGRSEARCGLRDLRIQALEAEVAALKKMAEAER